MNKSLENERAKCAFDCVSKVKDDKIAKQYLSLVRSFPIMLHNNGYITAMAYLYSKKNKGGEYSCLFNHVNEWLAKSKIHYGKSEDFMEKLTKLNNDQYRLYSNETTAFLIWLKRFAEGMIKS